MEPIEYVRTLIRRWPIIAVAAFIGALFAFFGTQAKPTPIESSFTARHTLLVNTNQYVSTQTQIGTITLAQVPLFATVGEVPRLVAEKLGFTGPPAALAAQVQVSIDVQTGTLTFSSTGNDPNYAVRVADTFADTTVTYLTERQENLRQDRLSTSLRRLGDLETEVKRLDKEVSSAVDDTDSITRAQRDAAVREYSVAYEVYRGLSENAQQDIILTTLERAQPVQNSTGGFTPPRTRASRVPIAAGLGALMGAALALLIERLDSRLRDRRRSELSFGMPVIAELPTLRRTDRGRHLLVGAQQHSANAEAFRSLRTSVTFLLTGGEPGRDDRQLGIIVITSPSPSEGKTTAAANLAAAFAETGREVIAVNADFRRPALGAVLISGQRPPLQAGLSAMGRVSPERYLIDTDTPGLRLLDLSPLGGSAGDLIRATVALLRKLHSSADVIIVDTPPLAVTAEALEFAPISEVLLLVGRLGRTNSAAAQRAGELARFAGVPHLAAVLSDVGVTRAKKSRYYEYYGGVSRKSKKRGIGQGSNGGYVDSYVDDDDEVDGQPDGESIEDLDRLLADIDSPSTENDPKT